MVKSLAASSEAATKPRADPDRRVVAALPEHVATTHRSVSVRECHPAGVAQLPQGRTVHQPTARRQQRRQRPVADPLWRMPGPQGIPLDRGRRGPSLRLWRQRSGASKPDGAATKQAGRQSLPAKGPTLGSPRAAGSRVECISPDSLSVAECHATRGSYSHPALAARIEAEVEESVHNEPEDEATKWRCVARCHGEQRSGRAWGRLAASPRSTSLNVRECHVSAASLVVLRVSRVTTGGTSGARGLVEDARP
jgi:hypothetical protein